MKASKNYFYLVLISCMFGLVSFSCNRGYGCPAENAKGVDLNKKTHKKPNSGVYDGKGRMDSKGYKTDHRKKKKSKNYKN